MYQDQIETVNDFLERYEERAKIDGRAGRFLAGAYVSWYRIGEVNGCNLYEFNQLDHDDRELFFKMLRLRENAEWRDTQLFELEQRLIEHWRIGM